MLKKDILELCILFLLKDRDAYGYEILGLLHDQFPDTQESVIYAQLRGLLKEGFAERYVGDVSGGPARKYYRITEKGRERLERLLGEWRALQRAMQVLGVR